MASASYALDTTGSITHMSAVPQGATTRSRLSRRCIPTRWEMKGILSANSAATVQNYAVYMVWDYHPNQVLPAITDIFDTVSPASLLKTENLERFAVLGCMRNSLAGSSTTPTDSSVNDVDAALYIAESITTTTADTTGVITDVISGALYLITMGNQAPGTSAATLTVTGRLWFLDDY